jgi:hypothetical protein
MKLGDAFDLLCHQADNCSAEPDCNSVLGQVKPLSLLPFPALL